MLAGIATFLVIALSTPAPLAPPGTAPSSAQRREQAGAEPAEPRRGVAVTIRDAGVEIETDVVEGAVVFEFFNASSSEKGAAIEGGPDPLTLDRPIPPGRGTTLEASLRPGEYLAVASGGGRRWTARFKVVPRPADQGPEGPKTRDPKPGPGGRGADSSPPSAGRDPGRIIRG